MEQFEYPQVSICPLNAKRWLVLLGWGKYLSTYGQLSTYLDPLPILFPTQEEAEEALALYLLKENGR